MASTEWDGRERRRSARIKVDPGIECRVLMHTRVKVLDVSATGALITSETFVPTGAAGRLVTALLAGKFAPSIHVLRNAAGRHPDRRELGVRFEDMDQGSREQLEAFLKRAGH